MVSDDASLAVMNEISGKRPDLLPGPDDWLDLDTLAGEASYIGGMVVCSVSIRDVFRTIARIGPHRSTVLIQGESGTGKELIARALHLMGPAPKGPFVTFNCSNLVESLAESQLFGHVRGAFTDAREDSLGYFRSASGGTMFLDEIGDLPLRLQPKLLRAVETKEVQPVGSTRSYHVDIRLVAATNRDLRTMVLAGHFRDDLYYRLNATSITIPPVRERREAIAALTAHFIEHSNRLLGRLVRYVSRRALKVLEAYEWPGNVRELAHAIESAVVLAEGDRIDLCHLPDYLRITAQPLPLRLIGLSPPASALIHGALAPNPQSAEQPGYTGVGDRTPVPSLDEVIKQTLVRSLEETGGNRRRAAELLKISRSTLYRMLARYELADLTRRQGHFPLTHAVVEHPKVSHT